ncbi:MAG TPA: 4-oxalocrotonate tautomerase DmpI [Desulfosporosinus sp.]|nr:4-oxalocrotonate tautomerase DmpI [Desulfosporosinus sp.]
MPFIQLEAGKLTKGQKEQLISGFTKVASEILGISEDKFIVLLKENELDNWGTGGKMLSKVLADQSTDK